MWFSQVFQIHRKVKHKKVSILAQANTPSIEPLVTLSQLGWAIHAHMPDTRYTALPWKEVTRKTEE